MRRALTLLVVGVLSAACQGPPAPVPAPTTASTPVPPPLAPTPTQRPVGTSTTEPVQVGAPRTEVLQAANGAFDRRDFTAAAELYDRVVSTPGRQGETATLSQAIDGLAYFRSIVALLVLGREDDARAQYDELIRRDASAPFARLATQFWNQYGMTADVAAACAQTTPQVQTQASSPLATLAAEGIAIPPARLCIVPA